MRFSGRLYRDGRHWLAEVPILDAMTQGRTRQDALAMVEDLLVTLVNRPGFAVCARAGSDGTFELASPDTAALTALLLRRRREKAGLSLAEVAKRLGASSRNTYARYEHGTSVPTLVKLDELFRAVSPGQDIVLTESTCGGAEPGT